MVRGVAVMGILAMNVIAFALPEAVAFNPELLGIDSPSDRLSWFLGFVLIDGKMRGLFSFLFGASMLLVIERADAADAPSASVHFARMFWLLLFGLLHFYLIWWGDILSLYAVVGAIAWFFVYRTPAALIGYGVLLILAQTAIEAQQIAGPHEQFGPDSVAASMAFYRGDFWAIAAHRLTADAAQPLIQVFAYGWETLGYMLLGMAALKTGFLKGRWPRRAYAWTAVIGLAVAVPVYAFLAWKQLEAGFSPAAVQAWNHAATTLVRPVMVAAIAALVLALARPASPVTERVAAVGRTAFTNYLGTSLAMTFLFYGWGLGWFGTLDRTALWLPVAAGCAFMLLWSKAWLERFRFGPFEWLWRSLARGKPQQMLRR